MKEAKIVALGGGTGLSTMVRGLKQHTHNITAIVTMSDDGGGSGVLREEMKMLPPGDVRNCIVALANTEPIMEQIFQYRFKEGCLEGQSFGNIFLAAMNDIFGSFELAVEKTSEVLAVTGQVLPITLQDVRLCAVLENGTIVQGETQIVETTKRLNQHIKRICLEPSIVKPYEKALEAIRQADIIILGPGSLYTSIIPNLLVRDVAKTIKEAKGKLVYIANLMTQPGETDGYTLKAHLDVIGHYLGGSHIVDYVIANNEKIPEPYLQYYFEDGAEPVVIDLEEEKPGLIEVPLISIKKEQGLVRHNENKLAEVIIDLV